MTRRKLPGQVTLVRVTISLREGEDADLLAAFAQVPPRHRARFIKTALRHGGLQAAEEIAAEDDGLAESIESFFV